MKCQIHVDINNFLIDTALFRLFLKYLYLFEIQGIIMNSMQYQKRKDNFNSLLDRFVSCSQGTNREQKVENVSNELLKFIKESQFIQLGLHLLLSENYSKDKLILVTSFIKDRFKFDFQLIPQAQLSLYYTKLAQLAHSKDLSYAAYTNVALSLAYIYINISVHSEQPLELFLRPLLPQQQSSSFRIYNYYFKTQEYIASEISNPKLVIDEQSRNIAKARIVQQQSSVLISLNQNGSKAWELKDIRKDSILDCFREWVTLSYSPQVYNSLPGHCLMHKMFHCVQSDQCTESATESLRQIIQIARDPSQNGPFFQYLGQNIFQLINIVQKLIQQSELSDAEQYLTLILDFSKKSVGIFVSKFQFAESFLGKLVKYLRDDLLQIYEDLADFWGIFLAELIVQRIQVSPTLQLLLNNLYDAICYRCNYPLRFIKQLNSRKQEKLGDFNAEGQYIYSRREKSQQLFQKFAVLQGKQNYLTMVTTKIQNVGKQDSVLWSYLQVYLFSLVQPIKQLPAVTPEVHLLINSYLQLNNNPTIVCPLIIRRTFLKLFRSLMSVQQKTVEFIQKLFYFTSTCFDVPLLIDTAEFTFWRGCELNYAIIADSTADLIGVLQAYPNREYIAKGIAVLLAHNDSLLVLYLPGVLDYIYQSLKKAESANSRTSVKTCMYSLIGVLKALGQTPLIQLHLDIVKNFTKNIWEYVKFVLMAPRKLEDDQDPEVERMVKLIKIIMRCLKFEFTEFVQDLYSNLITAYKKYPVCSYVYLVQIAITVFSSDAAYCEYLKNIYIQFCEVTYQHLGGLDKLQKYTFLLDDFIGMNKRFFIYNAGIVLGSGQLPQILQLCINAFMGCDTPRVAKAAYAFFQTIFMVYWRQEFIDKYNEHHSEDKFVLKAEDFPNYLLLRKFLIEKMDHIITKMLEHLHKIPAEATRQCILDALLAQVKAFGQQNPFIWKNILAALPSDILVTNEKQRFKYYLQRMNLADFRQVKTTCSQLKHYIYLIQRRMMNSANRTDIRL